MKSSFIIAVACSVLALGGCVVAIGDDGDGYSKSYTTGGSGYGSVYAADVDANTVSFTVRDNGCTDESFFEVDVRKTDDNAFNVGLERIREDYCKALNPSGQRVSWTFRELGIPNGAEISILNGVRR